MIEGSRNQEETLLNTLLLLPLPCAANARAVHHVSARTYATDGGRVVKIEPGVSQGQRTKKHAPAVVLRVRDAVRVVVVVRGCEHEAALLHERVDELDVVRQAARPVHQTQLGGGPNLADVVVVRIVLKYPTVSQSTPPRGTVSSASQSKRVCFRGSAKPLLADGRIGYFLRRVCCALRN